MPTRGTCNQGSHNTAAAVNQMEYWHCVNGNRRTSTPNLDNRFVANSSTAKRSSAGYRHPPHTGHTQTHTGEPVVRHSTQQESYMALRLRVLHHEQQLPSIGDHFHIQQPSFMDNRCVSAVPTNTPTPSVPQLRGTHNSQRRTRFCRERAACRMEIWSTRRSRLLSPPASARTQSIKAEGHTQAHGSQTQVCRYHSMAVHALSQPTNRLGRCVHHLLVLACGACFERRALLERFQQGTRLDVESGWVAVTQRQHTRHNPGRATVTGTSEHARCAGIWHSGRDSPAS